MYAFGKRSLANLETCHEDLQIVARSVIQVSDVDFTIIEGAREINRQQMLFDTGKSKVNPSAYDNVEVLLQKGKHLVYPGLRPKSIAFDFMAYIKGRPELAFDTAHLIYLSALFTGIGNQLLQKGIIRHKIVSGTNWDKDGVLKYDQSFFDAPHIQLNEV